MKNNYIDDFYEERIAICFETNDEINSFFNSNDEIFKKFDILGSRKDRDKDAIPSEIFDKLNSCVIFIYENGFYGYSIKDGLMFAEAHHYKILKFSNIVTSFPKTKTILVMI